MSDTEKCSFNREESKELVNNLFSNLIWNIGFIVVCVCVFKLLRSLWRFVYTCFIADLIGASVDWKKLPKWAVVTGSTDGIGKSYAKALAAKGFNIILVSRSEDKLKTVAKEIEQKSPVKTKIIAVDMTDDVHIYDKIRYEIEGLEIGVLVNNVGMSYPYAEYLTKVPNVEKFADNLIKANIVSMTRMTLLILPIMEKLGKGVIINVASISAMNPTPLLSMYSASKAYVNWLSKAIQEEYSTKGIIVQSVLPSYVSTNMSRMRPSMETCTPDAYVKWAMKTVGVETQTFGYPAHKLRGYLQELLISIVPETYYIALGHKMMNDLRKRYYKKYGLVEEKDKRK